MISEKERIVKVGRVTYRISRKFTGSKSSKENQKISLSIKELLEKLILAEK